MIDDLAASLRHAETTRIAIPPLRVGAAETSVRDAYRVQRKNTDLALASGRRIVGRKIGLTATAVQRQLGVNQPDFGVLFSDMEIANGGNLDVGELIQPRIEAEIAFVLGRDLDAPVIGLRQVVQAVDYVAPCLEIVDCRILNWDISIFDTVADNGAAARFVLGSAIVPLAGFDLIGCGMVLRAGGEVIATGAGAASLGNPLHAVHWLAEKAMECQLPLRAGEVILSGALGPMAPLRAGMHYAASISGLGSVMLNVNGMPS